MQQINEEAKNIHAGKTSANMIAQIVKGFNFIYDLARSLGSAIRRIQTKNVC